MELAVYLGGNISLCLCLSICATVLLNRYSGVQMMAAIGMHGLN